MTIIIGGHAQGLLDSSAALLKRNDRTEVGSLAESEQLVTNVANGNLVIQERDSFLSSLGNELALVRTYNSRGQLPTGPASGTGVGQDYWRWSTEVALDKTADQLASGEKADGYTVKYGDGSVFRFIFDAKLGYWISTDGAGSYETLQVAKNPVGNAPAYVLTRSDRSQYQFDNTRKLTAVLDRNGVRTDYQYAGGRLTKVLDAGGHAISLVYDGNRLLKVLDEQNNVLVQYQYDVGTTADGKQGSGQLVGVTDRAGLTTRYTYNKDGTLARIDLPREQVVGGVTQTFEARAWNFKYADVPIESANNATAPALSEVIDANGGRTTFDYAFQFSSTMAADDRDARFRVVGGGNARFFVGGSTQVVNSLGNARATSNAPEYVAWRREQGYYATFDANAIASNAALKAQFDAIRASHSLGYRYDADGYLTEVVDQLGIKTTYTYDLDDNLTSVNTESAPGTEGTAPALAAATASAPAKTAAAALAVASSTTNDPGLAQNVTYTYDGKGNVAQAVDGDGNKTVYTYTATNQLASMTAAMGDALATRDDLVAGDGYYRAKRLTLVSLGLPNAAAATLTAAQQAAIRALYTTTYSYDARDNLVTRLDPGGDRTAFQYDAAGNLTRSIVYLDATDLVTPSKQQATTYAYDSFGNNILIADAQGNVTLHTYDQFGNRLTERDGRGVTTNTYDGDNRLLSTTNALGHTTTYAYDSVGNRIRITDANGHPLTQIFDLNNRLIATLDPANAGPAQDRRTSYQYDVSGNRTAVQDANGNTTTYTYDAANRLVDIASAAVQDVNGNAVVYHERYSYDALGNVLTQTDNNGNITTYTYSLGGLLKSYTDAIGNVTEYLYDADRQRVQITLGAQLTLAQRRVLKFGYDEEDQKISETDALGGVKRMAYDAVGNVVFEIDQNLRRTDFQYDRNNRLLTETRTAVIDPLGQLVRYTVLHQYDANGNEVSTTNERGITTTYTFDNANRRVMMTDGNGIKTVLSWDSRNNQTQVAIGVDAHLDASGQLVIDSTAQAAVSSFLYDEFNQLIAATDGLGNALVTSDAQLYQNLRTELGFAPLVANLSDLDKTNLRDRYTERYQYDRVGNRTRITDHLGRITHRTYDALDRVQTITQAVGTAQARSTQLRYDGNDNLVTRTDALGRIQRFTFNANDRLVNETDALGTQTRYEYDHVGNLIADTRAFGSVEARTTRYIYDLNDRLTRQTDPELHVKQYEYDAVGNRLKEIDAKGNATQYVYDALNRNVNVRIIDALGFQTTETRFEYDGVGNIISKIDANGGRERLQYDGANRYVQTTDPSGRVTRFAYDRQSNVIQQTTAFGTPEAEVTQYVYDASGNLRQVTDAAGNVSTQGFDAVFNLTRSTDSNGNTTTTAFDALNRQIRVTNALGGITTYSYDLENNQLSETDALGRPQTFAYDAKNRLITQTDALGTVTTYGYDAVDNQIRITQAANRGTQARTDTFVYNKDDKLISQTDALGNTTLYAYDANHNVVSTTDALGRVTTYTYDSNNRVTRITEPLGVVTTYQYDRAGNRVQVIDANNGKQTFYYNQNNEVVLKVDALGNAVASSYDANGNLRTVREYSVPVTVINSAVRPLPTESVTDRITTFEYDKLNQLVKRTDAMGGIATMRYDAVGNQVSVTDENNHTVNFAYDKLNRQVAQLTAEGYLTRYTYDSVGNQIQTIVYRNKYVLGLGGAMPTPFIGDNPRVTTSIYDLNNRLVQRTPASGVATGFEYDAVGNQTAQVEAFGISLARRQETVFDAANRVIQTTDAAGVITRFDLDAVGNVLVRYDASGTNAQRTTRFAYDSLNRVDTQVDALGNTTKFSYDKLGNVTGRISALGLSEQRSESFGYDGNSRLVTQVNGAGERTEIAYDAVGNRIRLVLAPGLPEERVNNFEYDKDNRLVAEMDGKQVRTQYEYDAAGNKTAVIQAAGVAGQERRTLMTYSADNRLLSVRDPLGNFTSYEYDALGNQVRIIDPKGTVTVNVFDGVGRLVTNTVGAGGPNGGIRTIIAYDFFGNVLEVLQHFGNSSDLVRTRYEHDALNRQTKVTDGEGFSTVFEYDAFGNMTRIQRGVYTGIDPVKINARHVYDTRLAYDALDRLRFTTDGQGNVAENIYDGLGNRTSQTTGKVAPTGTDVAHAVELKFLYDGAGRVTERRTPTGGFVQLAYDKAGNLFEQKTLQSGLVGGIGADAPVWSTQRYEYDKNGRETARIDAYGVRTESGFDAVGNLSSTVYAKGTADERTVRFAYDSNNNQIAEIDALGGLTQFTYDAQGNVSKMTDALGRATRYYYDAFGRRNGQLDARNFFTGFTYDAAGNLTETRVFMTPVPGTVADGAPAPTPPSSVADRITRNTYDLANRITSQTAPDGSQTTYVYDSTDKLLKKTVLGAPDKLSITQDQRPRVQTWTYDNAGRIAVFTNVDGVTETYTYDAANNKISETIRNPAQPGGRVDPDRITRYEYDLSNRLVRQLFDPSGLQLAQVLGYDKAGNVVSKTDENGQVTRTQYDLENRVAGTIGPVTSTSFVYDKVGNRTAVTDAKGDTIKTEYDKNNRAIKEIHEQVQVYRWVNGALVPALVTPTTTTSYDAVGNVRQVTDANGNVTTHWYDATNNRIAERNGDNAVRRFTYDAAGALLVATQDMRFHTEAIDLTAPPSVVATVPSDTRTATNEYDLGGRVVKTSYSQIEAFALVGEFSTNPSATSSLVTPASFNTYDAFGNLVQSTDPGGRVTGTAYYDLRGRQVAVVDAEGFLTETDFDDQNNVVQQRKYTIPLAGAPNMAVRPSTATLGAPVAVDRIYDTASRLIEEISPPVHTPSGDVRVVTRFTYDRAGQLTSKTLGFATIDSNGTRTLGGANARAEYYYYDAAGRRVAVVGTDRVLNTFAYDGNGNLTSQKRYFDTIDTSVNLATVNVATATPAALGVIPNASADEETQYQYDRANRLIKQTELLGIGTADDLVQVSGYDANGNRTYGKNADNYESRTRHNASNQVVETVTPNGAHTLLKYDTGGLKVRLEISDGSGTSSGYVTEYEYNAMGVVVATSEDSGLWRRYGVDVRGNIIKTSLYGTKQAEAANLAPTVTYKFYGGRNFEIASFGADVDPTAGVSRAITRTIIDYAGRVISLDDPGAGTARTFVYDGIGNLVSSTDARGKTTTMLYNVFGELVEETDANLHKHKNVYDGNGRLIEEFDEGVSDHRYYTYDAFGRRTQVDVGNPGNRTSHRMVYDQRDRVTSVTNGENEVTRYFYDGRDNLIWTQDANNHFFGTAYDGMGLVTHQYSFQTRSTTFSFDNPAPTTLAQAKEALIEPSLTGFPPVSVYRAALVDEATEYDIFNNKIAEIDAEGRDKSFTYGAFGRLTSVSIAGAGDLLLTYDRFGNKVRETSGPGKNIDYQYDAEDRITLIDDHGTRTRTAYTYDIAGNRIKEVLEAPPDIPFDPISTLRNYSYSYDANGWMTSWTDAVSQIGETYTYDNVGNVTKVQASVQGNGNYFTHNYSYDNADRVLTAGSNTYAYDLRGRRATWNNGSTTIAYAYDNADRVITAGNLSRTYDDVGNVTRVSEGVKQTLYSYDTNNVNYRSNGASGDSTSWFDKSGRLLRNQVFQSSSQNFTYNYFYNPDGTENAITVTGAGTLPRASRSFYNVNGQLSRVDLGSTSDPGGIIGKGFAYDNQGNIVEAKSGSTLRNYLYADDQPVGEYESALSPTLDQGNYSVIRNVVGAYGDAAPDFPAATVTDHVVLAGETLQSIASAVYGHPELWYVIAAANGLTGSEPLQVGARLTIPNTVQHVGFTAQTQALYQEGDIVGSKLPNTKTPPPPKDKGRECAVIGAIILIVVVTLIAVVVTALTAAAAAPAAFAAVAATYGFAAGVIAGVVVAAAIGAGIAFTASVVTQGILIGFELQKDFDWKTVAADTAVGAFSGAAAGIGAIAGSLSRVTTAVKVANVIAQTALEVSGELTRQVIISGSVTDWSGVAIAGVTGGIGAVGDMASTSKKVNQAALKALNAADETVGVLQSATTRVSRTVGSVADVAKSGARNLDESVQAAGKSLDNFAKSAAKEIFNFNKKVFSSGRIGKLAALPVAALTLAGGTALAATYIAARALTVGVRGLAKGTGAAIDTGTFVAKKASAASDFIGGTLGGEYVRDGTLGGAKSYKELGRELATETKTSKQILLFGTSDETITRAAKTESELKAAFEAADRAAVGAFVLGLGAHAGEVSYNNKVGNDDAETTTTLGIVGSVGRLRGLEAIATAVLESRQTVEDAVAARQQAQQAIWLHNVSSGLQSLGVTGDSQAAVSTTGLGAKQTIDTDAAALFAARRSTVPQHGWVATSWVDTAVSFATQIVSPLAGVLPLSTALSYNRLLAGETSKFDARSIIELAAATTGRVKTNPIPAPIALLNASAPSPLAV